MKDFAAEEGHPQYLEEFSCKRNKKKSLHSQIPVYVRNYPKVETNLEASTTRCLIDKVQLTDIRIDHFYPNTHTASRQGRFNLHGKTLIRNIGWSTSVT